MRPIAIKSQCRRTILGVRPAEKTARGRPGRKGCGLVFPEAKAPSRSGEPSGEIACPIWGENALSAACPATGTILYGAGRRLSNEAEDCGMRNAECGMRRSRAGFEDRGIQNRA